MRPSQSDGAGTRIAADGEGAARAVTGVALVRDTARVTLADLPDRPGVMDAIFGRMAARKIAIDMVVQDAAADGRADVSFTVPEDDLADALTAAETAVRDLGAGRVRSGTDVSKVSAVGDGMKTHTGVAAHMFAALAARGINIHLVTTSDVKISVLVDRVRAAEAVRVVHEAFGLDKPDDAPPAVGRRRPAAVADAGAEAAREREVIS